MSKARAEKSLKISTRALLSNKARLCGDMVEEAAEQLGLHLKDGFREGVETGFIHGYNAAVKDCLTVPRKKK